MVNPLLFLLFTLQQLPMEIELSNLQPGKGQIMVAIFNKPQGFLNLDAAVFKQGFPVSSTNWMKLQLPIEASGYYAISCFQDLNNNGILDKNLLGIPTEPYAFSQNARPKFRAPSWEEAQFYYNGQSIQLKLESW
jgi:uncharacterized protein (DUF2141 family)